MSGLSSPWLERLKGMGKELTQGLVQLLYPGACESCTLPLAADQSHFCAPCRAALTTDPFPTCPRCAATVGPFANLKEGCTRCRDEVFHFDYAFRLGHYGGLLQQAILRMKSLTGERLAEALGDLLAEKLGSQMKDLHPEVIVPVPLHWWRRWQRGYNQSEAVAFRLAVHLGLRCRPTWLRRIRWTADQKSQSPTQRRENLRGAFRARVRPGLMNRCVLLVDDVLTTGSTANECARALRAAGATRIVVVIVGRAGTGQ